MAIWIPAESPIAIARREPSLLVPDKKPIGSVVVNNNRATRNLRGYYLVRSAADKNIAGDDLAIGSASDVMFDELGSIYNPATAGLHCGDVHDYPSELTILARIYWVSAGSTYSTIAARRAGATYQYQFRIWVNNLNFLGAGGSRTSTLIPVSNAWNNVAVAASAAGVLFYCNGSTTTASATALTSKSTTFSLGSTSDNSHPLGSNSYIRFVKVYDRRLTAEEIEAEFSDPYKDLLPANATPYLFGTTAAGGATLTVADATHGHTADNVALIQANVLGVADATHGHTAENVVLTTGVITLAVADALHGHTVDNISLGTGTILAVADSTHAHTVDGDLALTQANILSVMDAVHSHLADNIDLIPAVTLVVSDALHAHLADNVTMTIPGVQTEIGGILFVKVENRTLTVAGEDRKLTIH